jgi:hypothetical protein
MNKKLLNIFKKRGTHKFGHIVFAFGIILVIFFTLANPTILQVKHAIYLIILGLIVGLIDVPKREANSFILATIAIMVATLVKFEQVIYKLPSMQYTLGQYIKGFLLNTSVFLSIAMVIVALKIIHRVYKESK